VLSDILDAFDSQETTSLGLLDMNAAFDTFDFNILLRRLEISYRLNGHVLKWLTSFITDRTQAAVFGGATSSLVKPICGVLQGSVLGPLLFVLYAADVLTIALHHGVRVNAFAGDLHTYVSCKAVNQNVAIWQIQACITDIDGWLSSNRLKFSVDKTELTWLGTRQQLCNLAHQSEY
jgi:ribonucleases P/MRP protein subunit RPP40